MKRPVPSVADMWTLYMAFFRDRPEEESQYETFKRAFHLGRRYDQGLLKVIAGQAVRVNEEKESQ